MVRILVVEDEPNLASMMARALEREGYDVRVAHDGPPALKIAEEWSPELVTLCIRLPTLDGIEMCRRLRALPQTSQCPILFVTATALPESRLAAFEAGADDYLTKPFDYAEYVWRVRALLRRAQPLEPECLRVGPLTLNCHTLELQLDDKTEHLTRVEFALLSHLMRHPGQVFSNADLLQLVWGDASGAGSAVLLRANMLSLRRKIEPDPDNPTFLQTIHGRGYTLCPA
jgi:DNA-binding response OmpR family regulator